MLHAPPSVRKDLENRPRPLPRHLLGVPIAMHAGKHWDVEGSFSIRRTCGPAMPPEPWTGWADEGIVGVVTFGACLEKGKDACEAGQEVWYFGPFAYVVAERRALSKPIPCKGAMGWWTVPPEIAAIVEQEAPPRPSDSREGTT